MDAVATNVVEQRAQFVEGHPAGHNTLATSQYLLIEVVPLGTAALGLAHAWCPLDGVQLLDFQQGVEVVHSTHTIEVVERIVNLLALFADERLYEAAIVVLTDRRRDVTLQLRHLAWCPR